MEIGIVHILAQHFFNVTDNSSGIFFTAEDGGLDWLWRVIEENVSLFINDFKEFMKRGGQAFVGEQIRVVYVYPRAAAAAIYFLSRPARNTMEDRRTLLHDTNQQFLHILRSRQILSKSFHAVGPSIYQCDLGTNRKWTIRLCQGFRPQYPTYDDLNTGSHLVVLWRIPDFIRDCR